MVNNDSPMISVVVACYNNTSELWVTLDSIMAQDYPNIQLIVSDDCSDSFSICAVSAYITENKRGNITDFVVLRNSENLGTVRNLNSAIKYVRGGYIKHNSPGDTFIDRKALSRLFQAIGSADVLVTPVIISGTKRVLPEMQKFIKLKNSSNLVSEMLDKNYINIIGTLYRSELVKSGFNENYKLVEDWPLWLRLAREYVKFEFLDKEFCRYAPGGLSVNGKYKDFKNDVIRVYEREIIPYLDTVPRHIRRKAMFEYYYAKYDRSYHLTKIILSILYPDIVIKRRRI